MLVGVVKEEDFALSPGPAVAGDMEVECLRFRYEEAEVHVPTSVARTAVWPYDASGIQRRNT